MSLFESLFTSNAFAPESVKYQQQRDAITTNGVNQSLGILSGIFDNIGKVNQADDYAEWVNRNQAVARDNAMRLADAQSASNTLIADYSATIQENNATTLANYALSLQNDAQYNREQGFKQVAADKGAAIASYAGGGVMVGTGSAAIVVDNVVKEGVNATERQYTQAASEVRNTLNQVTQERLSAAFTRWSAEETNRFLKASVSQRL